MSWFRSDRSVAKGPFPDMGEHVRYVIDQPEEAENRCLSGEVLGIEKVFPRGITEELLSVKRHFELLLDKMAEGLFEINAEKRIIYASPAAISLVDRPEGELLGMPLGRLFSGADRERVSALIHGDQKVPKFISKDAPVTLNRSQVTMQVQSLGEREQSAIVILQDVTERKKAEKALQQANEYAQNIVNSSLDMIIAVDNHHRIVEFNHAAEQTFGYTKKEVLRKNVDMLYKDPAAGKALREKALRMENFVGEVENVRRDRTTFPALLSFAFMRDSKGQVIGSVMVSRDISDRKKAEEELKRHRTRLEEIVLERTTALRESEERYRLLFKYAPAGIFEVDLKNSKLIRVNDVMCRYTGYEESELLDLSLDALMAPEGKTLWKGQAKSASTGNLHPEPLALSIRGKGDRRFHALATSRFQLTGGVLDRATVVIHDLTEIKKAEEEKNRLERQLHRAQKLEALGTLAAGIAHDFNNLLMGILGNTSLMLMELDQRHPHHEKLKNIEQAVKRGEALAQRALGLVRTEEHQSIATNLNELIESSSKMFARTKREIRIDRKYQESVWTVNADPNQIDQVLLNLFVNAWQAMPEGGALTIETRNVELDEDFVLPYSVAPGKYVNVSVSDSGKGMTPEIVEKIFDPFFTTKEPGKGTGLGLAISYGIIQQHDGIIDVQSVPGKGTTFDIYLPASSPRRQPVPEPDAQLPTGKETILLVDDEKMVLDVGQKMLEKLGYRVITAPAGREALKIYRTDGHRIDMVILDMIMPDLGGGETLDELRAIDPAVKVLLVSGYGEQEKTVEIAHRGCRGFLKKPFSPKALAWKVREVLDAT